MKITPRSLYSIVCLIGCIYQSFKLSQIYFTYETSTNVKYESESYVELPAITICYKKLNQLKEGDPWHAKYADYDGFNKLTIGDQLEHLDELPVRLISCDVAYTKRCHDISYITWYITDKVYCFTLFSQLNNQTDDMFKVGNTHFIE